MLPGIQVSTPSPCLFFSSFNGAHKLCMLSIIIWLLFARPETLCKEKTFYGAVIYTHVPYHNDTIIKTDAMIKTQEGRRRKTSLQIYSSHFICKVSKRLCGVLL